MPSRAQIQLEEMRALQAEAAALLGHLFEDGGPEVARRTTSDEHHIPFVIMLDGEMIGTLTLGIDSPAGLAIDATFPTEVAALRERPGARLCELTKLAFDAAESRPLLAALFAAILQYAFDRYACTDVLIAVNPIHRRFYERMLGFAAFSTERVTGRAGAPVVAMKIQVTAILRRAAERASDFFDAHFTPGTGILQLSRSAQSARSDIRNCPADDPR